MNQDNISDFEIERDAILDMIPCNRMGKIINPRMKQLASMLALMTLTLQDLPFIRREISIYKLKHDAVMEKRDAFFRNVASRYVGDSPQTPGGQVPPELKHKENT